jgi:hypothetical protein
MINIQGQAQGQVQVKFLVAMKLQYADNRNPAS